MKKILLLIPTLALFACEKRINYDIPNEGNKLTAVASIEAGRFEAYAGISEYILSADEPLYGIQADGFELYENGNLLREINPDLVINLGSNDSVYRYRTQYNFTPGNTYRIKIYKDGFNDIEGRTKVPFPPVIISASYDIPNNKITLSLQDDFEGEENYYRIRLFLVDEDGDLESTLLSTFDPTLEIYDLSVGDFLDLQEGEKIGIQAYLKDEHFDGSTKKITIYDYLGTIESVVAPLVLEIAALSEDQYRWEITKEINDFVGDNPFAEPVQVHSNIKNGFGILGSQTTIQIDL